MVRSLITCLLLVGVLLGTPVQAIPTLTLDPVGGALSGIPGSTVGWGFTLANDSDYLVVSSAEFTGAGSLGVFTDFIAQFNSIVVGPSPENTSVSQAFGLNAHTGIGSFAIDAGASVGGTATGFIEISYDLFSVSPNDPNFDPGIDSISFGNTLRSNASVTVTSTTGQIPEPNILALLFIGFLPLVGVSRKCGRI
jgi:hypothetical protein